ncbi:CD209 antigen-like protein B [Falco biarmicus]|uniref:CD209 antigen-like protein B n=1 Tax=Falco biarmicus TaxID=345155 RepID=UPI0024BD365F|nr:CD209 antigen-like protein B [Falco biarmicus]
MTHLPHHIKSGRCQKEGPEMSQGDGAVGTYEKWDSTETMELEKREQRRAPKGALAIPSIPASPLERAIMLLYILLALTIVIFMALTIVNIQRVSAMWEVLEQARMRSENSHTTAWHNLSEVQHTLDKQLSGELKAIHSQFLNVSREVENMGWKVTQCKAECGKELSNRLQALEEKDVLEPVLRQLAEMKQEQSRTSALLDTALEEARNLSGILCTRCPDGWQQFAKTCYFFSSSTKSWQAAKEFCATFDAHMPIVNTEQENKFLANHVMENRVFWLGLSDMHKEGDWQWVNGNSLSLSYVFSLIRGFWNSGEPNNVGDHGEDCATIFPNGRWNDVSCSNAEAWICERSC